MLLEIWFYLDRSVYRHLFSNGTYIENTDILKIVYGGIPW